MSQRSEKSFTFYFLIHLPTENSCTYDECHTKMRQASSYTNMCKYVNANNRESTKIRLGLSREAPKKLFQSLTYRRRTKSLDGCLEYVILCLQPFSFCETIVSHWYFKQDRICRYTFTLYMEMFTKVVEHRINVCFMTNVLLYSIAGWEERRTILAYSLHVLPLTA